MAVRRITLDEYLIEARRIAEHRTEAAEQGIRRTYKKVLKELQHFLADAYIKYAENDTLTFEILQRQNEYANFMETIQKNIDGILHSVHKEIRRVIEQTYSNAYLGMIKAVKQANTASELHINLKGIEACRPEVVKRAVENPISGLTLKDRLEKNRINVIYEIKQQIGVGLVNGDRYTTMAERVSKSLDEDYKKSVRIVRTETHRVEEAGNLDASLNMEEELNAAGMCTSKTWITMKDVRVRKNRKADHKNMNGKSIPVYEEFDLGRGIKAMSPGNSGDAANDIHCRCFLSYALEELEEFPIGEVEEKWTSNTEPTSPTCPKLKGENPKHEKALNEMAETTMKKAHQKQVECSSLISSSGDKYYNIGSEKRAGFSKEMDTIAKNAAKKSLSLMHNHPYGGKPTVMDILNFGLYPSIKESIILLGNRKAVRYIAPKKQVGILQMQEDMLRLSKQYNKYYNKQVAKGAIKKEAALVEIELRIADDMIKLYGIERVKLG